MKDIFIRSIIVLEVVCMSLFAQTPPPVTTPSVSAPEPLRSKIIRKKGKIQLWSKSAASMTTLEQTSDLSSGKTLIIDKGGYLHITFEPLIDIMITGPATVGFDNVLIDRTNGAIRMLCSMDKGTVSLRAPPQAGNLLLFTLKTPSAVLDASVVEMTVNVDSGAVTTTDVRHGSAKILPGRGGIRTVVYAGSRSIAARDKAQLKMSAIPDSAKFAKIAVAQKKQPSIGILSIKSTKKTDENLEHISNSVAREFEKTTNAKILFLDDIRKLLHTEGNDRLLNCYTDSCISKIGSDAGVDIVIVGNLGQLGSAYILDLRMIDVLRDRLLSRASISVADDLGKILGEIPGAIGKLVIADTLLSSVIESPATRNISMSKFQYQELVVWIFPGRFTMGSQFNSGEVDELPTHQVKLNGFYIDRFEVTRDEFEKIMGYNPVPARGCGNCPVTNVTWQEASDYCTKIGKRLPTEAEWEYACRAGTSTPFYVGVTLTDEQANFNAQKPFGGAQIGKFNEKTVPVGDYPPNGWNLHDMYGNAAEWCSDWYDVAYYGNSPIDNPKGPEKGTLKVVRGGSWNSAGNDVRSANRMAYNPELRLNSIGFRCVKTGDGEATRK